MENVAVDDNSVLSERLGVDDGAEASSNEPRNLVCATTDFSLDALTVVSVVRGAREHRVLSGHPPFSFTDHPTRHAVGERRGAQNLRVSERNQGAPLSLSRPAPLDDDRAKLVVRASVNAAHDFSSFVSEIAGIVPVGNGST